MDQKDALDRLQFLHDRRIILFNTRRDHEWKILFGVVGLFVAVDAAQLAYSIHLLTLQRATWDTAIVILFISCFLYLRGVQERNINDRRAMNWLNNRFCRELNLREPGPAFENEQHSWKDVRYSFWNQVIFLGAVALLSALLPWTDAGKRPASDSNCIMYDSSHHWSNGDGDLYPKQR